MAYRYDFACEMCDWPKPAKNLIKAFARGQVDTVYDLEKYFMEHHQAKFVYTTKEVPITHVLFPSEHEATMFLLRWS